MIYCVRVSKYRLNPVMNSSVDKEPSKESPAPSAGPLEPPRILDRMLSDMRISGESAPRAAAAPIPSQPLPPKAVRIPSNVLEPAPANVFTQSAEKPPKRLPKIGLPNPQPAFQEYPINGTPGTTPPASPALAQEARPQPRIPEHADTGTASLSTQSPLIAMRLKGSRTTIAIVGLVILNLALIATLMAFSRRTTEQPEQHVEVHSEPAASPPPVVIEEEPLPQPAEVIPVDPLEIPPPIEHLDISKLELARAVSGFALYDPIPDIPLLPHHVSYMFVYTEVINPKPEERSDARYIYNLTKTVRLYRADVGPTEPLMHTTVSMVEHGRSPRRDFYARQQLQSARRIEPGEHIIDVQISDRNSGETVNRQTSFIIHAP